MSVPKVNGVPVALPPPPGYEVDFENPKRQTVHETYIVAGVGMTLAFLFLCQRLYVKAILRKKLGFDDALLVLAWVGTIAIQAIIIRSFSRVTMGVHGWEIPFEKFQEFNLVSHPPTNGWEESETNPAVRRLHQLHNLRAAHRPLENRHPPLLPRHQQPAGLVPLVHLLGHVRRRRWRHRHLVLFHFPLSTHRQVLGSKSSRRWMVYRQTGHVPGHRGTGCGDGCVDIGDSGADGGRSTYEPVEEDWVAWHVCHWQCYGYYQYGEVVVVDQESG